MFSLQREHQPEMVLANETELNERQKHRIYLARSSNRSYSNSNDRYTHIKSAKTQHLTLKKKRTGRKKIKLK